MSDHQDPDPIDRLGAIFELQREFRTRVCGLNHQNTPEFVWGETNHYSGELGEFQAMEVEQALIKFTTAISQEAAELMDWCRWKDWSAQLGNRQSLEVGSREWLREVRMETIDILRFLVNAMAWLGMAPGLVLEMCAEKHAISHQRLDEEAAYRDHS